MARPRASDAEDVIEQDAGEPTIVGVPLMPRSKPAPRIVRAVSNQKMFDDGSVDDALSKLGGDEEAEEAPADEEDPGETVVAAEAPDLDAQETEISKDFESPRAATTALRPAIMKPPGPSTRPVTIPPRSAEPAPALRPSTPTAPPESRPKTPTAKRASTPSRVSLSVDEQIDEPQTIVRLGQPGVLPDAPSRGLNRTLIAILATAGVVGGLAIATYVLVLKDRPAVAPAPLPTPAPVAPAVVPVDAAVAAVAPPPPPPSPSTPVASAELTSIEHPVIETLTTPVAGQVAIATKSVHAKVGDTVVTVKGKPAANPRVAELETKIKALEEAAAADPAAPAEELAKARTDLAALQQPVMTWVKATKSGSLELKVALHAELEKGAPLAIIRDDRTWVGVARFTEQPTAMWSCAVSSADHAKTAACRIQATEVVDGATRVTVEIAATPATSWLRDSAGPRLLLAPPTGR